jgi:hypothetical protein
MDLNLNNYSDSEIINILQVKESEISLSHLQKCLYIKIDQLKQIDPDNLPESKENLIEFYTKGFFKLLKNLNEINSLEANNSLILNKEAESEDAFGKIQGNNYKSASDNNLNQDSINIRSRLLPPMMKTPIVQENSKVVEKHIDQGSINTFDSHLKYGLVNPLTRKSFKKVFNINTKFRDNYTSTSSTDFTIYLPTPIKKVVSMKVLDTQFPKMVYTFSSKLGSNTFKIDSSNVDISNGSYTSTTLVSAINTSLANVGSNVILSYNSNNGLMTFTDPSGSIFGLNFNYDANTCPQLSNNIYKDQLTLGWILGFRGNYLSKISSNQSPFSCLGMEKNQVDISNIYMGASSYTGESLFDAHGSRYFLVAINDYQNNHNNIFISPFQYQTIADNNIMAKVSTECCNVCCISHPERIYFGPTRLSKLHISIYDEFGRIVDINNADYSLTLELEILYDL